MAEFAATARRLQRERESAAEVVQRLLRETPKNEWPWLARRTELHTNGALEELAKRVETQLDREPREALVIAEVAAVIADAIPDDAYPPVVLAQMRAQAWKDRGQALDYLARYDEALAALDRAEEQLAVSGTLAHELAIVHFVRATTLQNVRRYDESLQLLNTCRDTFREHGDLRRRLICGIAEGALLHRLCRYREARETYAPLLQLATELQDTESLACLSNVLGYCSVELNQFEDAERYLGRAVQLFVQLQQPLHATRAELARGRMMLRRGDYPEALPHLTAVRDEFLRRGLVEEAGLSGLDMVAAHIALGAPSEAETLARRIVAEFSDARLSDRAITALGYLTEAIAARSASERTVGTVRDYIHSLRTFPEREFVAYA